MLNRCVFLKYFFDFAQNDDCVGRREHSFGDLRSHFYRNLAREIFRRERAAKPDTWHSAARVKA
jgi:hypothetical protein